MPVKIDFYSRKNLKNEKILKKTKKIPCGTVPQDVLRDAVGWTHRKGIGAVTVPPIPPCQICCPHHKDGIPANLAVSLFELNI